MPSNNEKITFIINIAYLSVIALLIILFFKYFFVPLSPFLTAFIIVTLSKSLIKKLSGIGISRRWAVILIYSAAIFILSVTVFWIFRSISLEAISLYKKLSQNELISYESSVIIKLKAFIDKFPSVQYFFNKSQDSDYLNKLITSLISTVIPKFLEYILSFLKFFPQAVIFITITAISLFYIGIDYEKILSFISLQFSDNTKKRFSEIKNVFADTAKNLFRAYFLLTFITFIQLLCGFLILHINYAFILAAIISIIDLFPILGTGTVLLPWALYNLFDGNLPRAVGLCILYVTILFFRQIAEPKIVGFQTGISPLLSLVAMFCGLKILGITGLFIFPVILITIKSLNESGSIHLYKNSHETKAEISKKIKRKFISFSKNKKQ